MILDSSGDIRRIDLEIIDTSIAKNNVRERYIRYTDQQRFQISKYASENGTTASVRKYRTDFPKINESTVRGFKKHYEEEPHRAKKMGREVSKKLPIEKQGRPRHRGDTLDTLVQKYIRAQSNRGNAVKRSMAVSTAKVLMRRYPKGVGKVEIENSEWAKSSFKRMHYRRRKATTAKLPMPPGIYKEMSFFFITRLLKLLRPTASRIR